MLRPVCVHVYLLIFLYVCIQDKIPVVNPRYQRMQNANRWINRPIRIIPTGTILQSRTQPHNQTIRKSTNPKDFMTKSSRYCLLSQEQDVNGELEIYKVRFVIALLWRMYCIIAHCRPMYCRLVEEGRRLYLTIQNAWNRYLQPLQNVMDKKLENNLVNT